MNNHRLWVRDITRRERFEQAPPERRARVRASHIRIFYELSRLAAVVSLLIVVLMTFNLAARVPALPLFAWAAGVALVALARALLSWRFLRLDPNDAELPAWGAAAAAVSLLQGISWGVLLFIVRQWGNDADLLLTVFLMCALAFGSFATLGFYVPAFLSFSLPILVMIGLWFLWFVPEMTFWVLALLLLAGGVMSQAGIRATRVLRGALLALEEREEQARETTAEKERMQVTLRSIGEGVISVDGTGRVSYMNPMAEQITGWRDEEARGQPLAGLLRLQGEEGPLPDLLALARERGAFTLEGERRLLDRDGGREARVQLRVSSTRGGGREAGAVLVLQDVTELSGLAEAMSYQARYDTLTGLVNRVAFEASIADAMEYARHHRAGHALCYLDLDQFKIVNDICGHGAGDELLRQLAERLRRRVRDTDVMARLGGDEFGLLLFRCSLEKAKLIADDLCAIVRDFRFQWDDKVFNVGVSVGLVPFDGEGSAMQVLAAADAACYVAKDQGRNRVHIAYPGDVELASRHGEMRLISQIQQAMDEDRFRLRYQKILPLGGERTLKAEFLASMLSPEGELVPPGTFLAAAERFNMMPRLDRHLVRLALRYVASDRPELAEVDTFTVNVSGQSLADEDFLDYVVQLLRDTGVDPRRICWEITETAVIANLDRAKAFIDRLRGLGCQFALDDFGSGLSSFGYLKTLPVDFLKIDGQFVRQMCDDPIDRSMVEAIHQVGHIMGLKTIAEFVEDGRTREALVGLGVDYGQGWGLHRPTLLEHRAAVALEDLTGTHPPR